MSGIDALSGRGVETGGSRKCQGIISDTSFKDPTDTQWQNDAGYKWWSAFMDKYLPSGDRSDLANVYGSSIAATTVQVLKQCGDDLTRENVMRQAANLHRLELTMLLPGITINTSPTDFAPIKQVQMKRFDGERFIPFGPHPRRLGPVKGDRSGLDSAVIAGCRLRAEGLA